MIGIKRMENDFQITFVLVKEGSELPYDQKFVAQIINLVK